MREVREAGREGRECMELHPSPQQCRDREEGGVITQCSERTAPQTEHVKDMFVSSESEEVPCYADSRFRETFISSADPTGWNGLGCESGDRRTLLPPDRESLHRNTDRESLHRTNRHGQGFQARTNIQLNPTFDSSYQC